MTLQVKDIMTTQVASIDADAPVRTAALAMGARNLGFLPVKEGDRLVGVVTDRDLALRSAERSQAYESTTVREVMSPRAHAIRGDTEVAGAAAAMKSKAVRRLLVLDDNSRFVGVVSLSDIAARSTDPELAGATLIHLAQARSAHTVAGSSSPN